MAVTDPTAGALRAAAVRVDITPGLLEGLHPVGGGSFLVAHDPIFLRTLLLSHPGAELAIISLDLIEVGDTAALRARIETELGIRADHVLICPTHTHSAPRLGTVTPGGIAHDPSPEALAYGETVEERILESLRRARADLRPARIGHAAGTVDLNVNRDEFKNGAYRIGVNPDGPSDKALNLIDVIEPDGSPIAVLMSYAVHPTLSLGTRQLSGDISGAASRRLEQVLGDGVVALWAAGALGDQEARNQIPRPPLFEPLPEGYDPAAVFELVDAHGQILAGEAARVRSTIQRYLHDPRIQAAETVIALPCRHREARGDGLKTINQQPVETTDLRVIVALIGTIALVGVGGELVTELGKKVRESSPLTRTLVLSIVNDRLGYLLDDAGFAQQTHAMKGSPIKAGYAERAIVGAASDTLYGMLA